MIIYIIEQVSQTWRPAFVFTVCYSHIFVYPVSRIGYRICFLLSQINMGDDNVFFIGCYVIYSGTVVFTKF